MQHPVAVLFLAVAALVIAGGCLIKKDDERRAEKRSYEKGLSLPIKRRK